MATSVYGAPDDDGQSPFAIGAGNQFERRLYENNGARLLELYRGSGRLAPEESKVVNIADRIPGRTARVMADRVAETQRLVELKLNGDPRAPNILIKPRFEIPFLGRARGLEPDHLIASDADPSYQVAEVKAYPDRRGKTDTADLRGALRQAAVGVVGLRIGLSQRGVRTAELVIPARADLILRRPGSFLPTLHSQAIVGEVDSIVRMMRSAPASLARAAHLVASGATLSDQQVLDGVPNNYNESCREHCPLVQACKRQALAVGDPVLIGSSAREMLSPAGSIPRAIELLRGNGPPARTPDEQDLQNHLRTAEAAYTRAVSNV